MVNDEPSLILSDYYDFPWKPAKLRYPRDQGGYMEGAGTVPSLFCEKYPLRGEPSLMTAEKHRNIPKYKQLILFQKE